MVFCVVYLQWEALQGEFEQLDYLRRILADVLDNKSSNAEVLVS